MTEDRRVRPLLLAGLLVVLLAPAELVQAQALRFVVPRVFPIGGNPADVVAAHLDGDDHLDLVVTNYDQASISVLRGDGTGDFSPLDDQPASIAPTQMACADFDGDEVLDLVISETESDAVHFHRGRGDASFENPVTVRSAHDPAGVVAAFMNDDAILDVVVSQASEAGGGVDILLGNGDGSFEFDEKRGRRLSGESHGIGVGDFDGDGNLDVAATTLNTGADDAVGILLGDGAGGLGRVTSFVTGSGPYALAVGDLDGDDRLDVLVADGDDGTLSFMKGDGAGMLERAGVTPVGIAPATLDLFDVDGNELADAVTANTISGDASVVPGRGAAGFGRPRHFAAPLRPFAATAGDFDEDGRLDIVVVSQSDRGSAAYVLLQHDDGFEAIESVAPEVRSPRVASGDVDGDGRPDLVVGDQGTGRAMVLPSLGRRGFGAPIAVVNGFDGGPMTLADVDGDGRLDLIASTRAPSVSVAFGLPSGGFSTPMATELPGTSIGLEVGDFDRDGHLDVASVSTMPAAVTVLFAGAGRAFSATRTIEIEGSPSRLAAGDFDVDGATDLAVGNGTRAELTLLLTRPGRTFETSVPDFLVASAFIASGDFDADGADDLVATGGLNAMIRVLLNDGRGNFTDGPSVSAGGFVSAIALRDLTGDSLPDVMVTLQNASTVGVAVNSDGESLASPVELTVGFHPSGAFGADFDADGRYDLAVHGDGTWVVTNAGEAAAPRGDGNGDGNRTAADVVALFAELNDGRRQPAERARAGTFASSIGLDANGDGIVDPLDAPVLVRRLFS